MNKKTITKGKQTFKSILTEGQTPLLGNFHEDIRIFALMNMHSGEGEECVQTLQRNNLIEPFENTYQLLKEISKSPPTQHPRKVAELAPGLMTSICFKISAIKSDDERKKAQDFSQKLAQTLLIAFVNGNQKYANEIIHRISEILELNCRQLEIKPNGLLETLKTEFTNLPGWISAGNKTNGECSKLVTVRCIWNNQHNLPELVFQLKKKNLIKRRKAFFDLFENPSDEMIVEWDETRIPELARLLYCLFTQDYCHMRGSKGYFTYAEKHFVTFDGTPIPKGNLKKLSSRINKQPEKYIDVINTIDEVLKQV